jgi:exodeoxyribonuclease V gamma subunit
MFRVVYSNRTEELLSELADRVRAQQMRDGALLPVRIVAPNATIEQYVHFGIARRCGIAANLQTTLLGRFAADAIAQATGVRVAGAEAFEAMALSLFFDESFVAAPELAPVRAYLAAGNSREAADVRRVQLAGRIGRLFEQYTSSRAEMLEGWLRGPTLDGRLAEREHWQRQLWLAMCGAGGLARARGLLPLHEAIAAAPAGAFDLSRTVHVFGFAHFARGHHDLLACIARAGDVVVYALSPCEGFWEDFDLRDPAPLKLWARPGREHVRALNAAADFDHEDRFVAPEGGSLLACLQRDILAREPVREGADLRFAFANDESIVLLENTSQRRELEAVASEIWRLVEGDPTLRFNDIAVLLPDADAGGYLAHLPAVFREAYEIPHQRVDLPDGGAAHVTEAVELLLALPLGQFTRQELLRFALHPAALASLDDVDPGRWVAWCDALGIVHGADRSDHEDTYIERDILNWDQGLRRLALGVFMAGDASGERRPYELAGEAYLPHEIAASEVRDAAALGLFVRSLVADARFVQTAELPLKEWALLLRGLVEAYIAPPADEDGESLARCLRRLHSIGDVDLGDRRVPYRVACELARNRISSPHRGRGGEGVIVSRLTSAPPIPFRVVFACGMGEGRFPSPEADDPLDLRSVRRLAGDVTARDGDKYAFLEALLGTRDRLYLSYVSRDPLTGDTLAPSSVVQELLHALGRTYLRDTGRLLRRHPLRRWDPRYFPDLFSHDSPSPTTLGTMRLPEARAEARTLALRRGLEVHGVVVDRQAVQARAASDGHWASLAEHLRIAPLAESSRAAEARLVMPMYALVKFLDFPLQGWARFRVGLDEFEEEDALERADEPFETDFRDETLLLRGVFLAASKKGSTEPDDGLLGPKRDPLDEAYDEVVRDREMRGSGPSGVFAQGERAEHLRTLRAWKERLEALPVSLDAIELHRFGRAGEHATADHAHPPLVIEVDVADPAGVTRLVRVEIGGRTLPVAWPGSPGPGSGGGLEAGAPGISITLSRRAKEGKDDWERADRQRAMLRAFVDHAVLSASGVSEGRSHGSLAVVATPQGTVTERVSFAPMSRGEAIRWLRGLARELLRGPHAYFLPSEAVLVWRAKGGDGPVVRWLELARERLRDGEGPPALRSVYGPVPRPHEYPVPDERTARAVIESRFGVLFEKTVGEAQASS